MGCCNPPPPWLRRTSQTSLRSFPGPTSALPPTVRSLDRYLPQAPLTSVAADDQGLSKLADVLACIFGNQEHPRTQPLGSRSCFVCFKGVKMGQNSGENAQKIDCPARNTFLIFFKKIFFAPFPSFPDCLHFAFLSIFQLVSTQFPRKGPSQGGSKRRLFPFSGSETPVWAWQTRPCALSSPSRTKFPLSKCQSFPFISTIIFWLLNPHQSTPPIAIDQKAVFFWSHRTPESHRLVFSFSFFHMNAICSCFDAYY